MNKLAIITGFLGGVKNRYITYEEDRDLVEKFKLASQIKGLNGFELCYPADFSDLKLLKTLLADHGFGVSAVNVRTRRTGKWWRGSFTSSQKEEREDVVIEMRKAIDATLELGATRITTCPLNDGHDYVFEMNYIDAYRYAQETFAAICSHDRSIKICIEYKWNDPRTRCFFASAGETASFCDSVNAENLGATLDIGHSIQTGERPAQAAALLAQANRLFYVHLNDNDRNFDWDLIPGAFNFWDFIEFLFYLKELGYQDDWYAYDVMSKEIDTIETFNTVFDITRKLESLANKIDRPTIFSMMQERNPARTMRYLYEKII
jgi:xylose isomerase